MYRQKGDLYSSNDSGSIVISMPTKSEDDKPVWSAKAMLIPAFHKNGKNMHSWLIAEIFCHY